MSIIDALKKLVVAFGGADDPSQVQGDNIADVVDKLSEIVTPASGHEEYPLIKNEYFTAKKGATATVGYLCHMSANNTVANTPYNGAFCGVIADNQDTKAIVVQCRGFVTVPYSGMAPSVGYAILTADGAGGVHTAESGNTYLITNVDTTNRLVTLLL